MFNSLTRESNRPSSFFVSLDLPQVFSTSSSKDVGLPPRALDFVHLVVRKLVETWVEFFLTPTLAARHNVGSGPKILHRSLLLVRLLLKSIFSRGRRRFYRGPYGHGRTGLKLDFGVRFGLTQYRLP